MAISSESLLQLMQTNGLALLFPLAILEGPIVSVIAGWLVRIGVLGMTWTYLVLIIADLVGDLILYAIGRFGRKTLSLRWQARLGLTGERLEKVAEHFGRRGGRTLIVAKVTHSFGFAVLMAAGTARMRVLDFLWFNLLGTIPKTAFFLALGYAVGEAHLAIDHWIGRGTLIIGVIGVVVLVGWLWQRRRQRA